MSYHESESTPHFAHPGMDRGRDRVAETYAASDDASVAHSSLDAGDDRYMPINVDGIDGYEEPNFKPLVLGTGFLTVAALWFFLCLAAVTGLVVVGRKQPRWLRFQSQTSYNLWIYLPNVIASVTVLAFRSIVQQYYRIMPYVKMANVTTDHQPEGHNLLHTSDELSTLPGFIPAPGRLLYMFRRKEYLAFTLSISLTANALLAPFKSSFLQPVEDIQGWQVTVSVVSGAFVASIYLVLFASVVCLIVYLKCHKTGLRWSPCSIASQLSLVQGSNIFPAFTGLELTRARIEVIRVLEKWPSKYGTLRLGYWRQQHTGLIVHGIRFFRNEGTLAGGHSRVAMAQGGLQVHENEPAESQPEMDSEGDPRTYGEEESFPMRSLRTVLAPQTRYTPLGPYGATVPSADHDTGPEPLSILGATTQQSHSAAMETEGSAVGYHRIRVQSPVAPLQDGDELESHVAPPPDGSVQDGNEFFDQEKNQEFSSRYRRPRVGNFYLTDVYILPVFLIGITLFICSIVYWAKGSVSQPIAFRPKLCRLSDDLRRQNAVLCIFERGLVFNVLPVFLFGLFSPTFIVSDQYHRTMRPIQNMAASVQGTSAQQSVLLDYLSTDPVSTIANALVARNFRIAWGVILATGSTFTHVIIGRIFVYGEVGNDALMVNVKLSNFYGAFAVLVLYCIAIWVARPYGRIRTCWPIFTFIDFVSLCYQSPILRCPEFWVQQSDDQEEHLKAQVTLAKRRYFFAGYLGHDDELHLGITTGYLPSWRERPDDDIDCLQATATVARKALNAGFYDVASREALQALLPTISGPLQWRPAGIYTGYNSWKISFRRLFHACGNILSIPTGKARSRSHSKSRLDRKRPRRDTESGQRSTQRSSEQTTSGIELVRPVHRRGTGTVSL
ncbi:hypothetical protein AYO20_03119 [Fonsecaea nubica]|uniref:Uncharacterized protein n=1 Tax=Fonsecaea nubica TaxID=856822 RepID=A0A178D7Q3_9EURO|nr:hypothetical protein AYO20_03119 [Fonsecaea nubica]OAL37612.1 hypothetical protein AYO20_03119 [Fonsecaea nubica]